MEQVITNNNLENTITLLTKQIKNITTAVQENNDSVNNSINKLLKFISNTKLNEQTIDQSKNLNLNILNLVRTINDNTKTNLIQQKQNQIDQEKNRNFNIKQNSFLFNPVGRLDEEISKLTSKTISSISDSLGKVVGNFGGLKTLSNLSKSNLNYINLQQEKRQSIINDSEQDTENAKQLLTIEENKDNLKSITVTETKSYEKLTNIEKTLKDIKDILDIDDAEKDLLKQKQTKNRQETDTKQYIAEKKQEDKEQGPNSSGSLLSSLVSGIGGIVSGAAVTAIGYEMSKVTKLLEWGSKIPKIGTAIAKGTELAGAGLTKLAKPITAVGRVIASKMPVTAGVFGKSASAAGKVVSKVAPIIDVGMLGYGTYKGVTMSEEAKRAEIERLEKANSTIGGAAWETTKTFFDTAQQGKNIALATRETGGLAKDIFNVAESSASVDTNEINYIKKAGLLYNIPQVEIDKLIRMPSGNERTSQSYKVIQFYKNKKQSNKLDFSNPITHAQVEGNYNYQAPVLVPGDINIPLKPIPNLNEINKDNKELIKIIDNRLMRYEEATNKGNEKIIDALEKIYSKETVATNTYINQSNYPSFNSSVNYK